VNDRLLQLDDLPAPKTVLPRINRAFYTRNTVAVARALLGQLLVRQLPDGTRLAGLIVETEAYLGPDDRAAHTYNNRRTPRNNSMWQRGGTGYVDCTYGMHHCFNVVTREADTPQAVLIRALQPVEGIEAMTTHRPAAKRVTDLCSGPAKLCAALQIDRGLDGVDLCDGTSLYVEQAKRRSLQADRILAGPRVGIGYAEDWVQAPLRFSVAGNRFVSRPLGLR